MRKPPARSSKKKQTRSSANDIASKLAKALMPDDKKSFSAAVRVGARKRQLLCFARSELGAKRIAGRLYREMYPDRTVQVLSVTEV